MTPGLHLEDQHPFQDVFCSQSKIFYKNVRVTGFSLVTPTNQGPKESYGLENII